MQDYMLHQLMMKYGNWINMKAKKLEKRSKMKIKVYGIHRWKKIHPQKTLNILKIV